MQEYEINSTTLLMMPVGNNTTRVLEVEDECIIHERCVRLVDYSCRFFGSSLFGRQEGTKAMIGVAVKAPIVVEESKGIIFFPTHSPRESCCTWIAYNNLLKYIKLDSKKTRLYFVGGKTQELDVSYNIIDNQITRCIRLEKVMFDRQKDA